MIFNNRSSRKAFTLAEVMIVFTVIGVLSAILIPTLFTSTPEQQKLKAKKAFNTITRAVESLTNSGPYDVTNGILESKSYIQGTDQADIDSRNRFFCNNLSEILNVRKSDCSLDNVNNNLSPSVSCPSGSAFTGESAGRNALCMEAKSDNSAFDYENFQKALDTSCEAFWNAVDKDGYNLKTADNVLWGVQLTDFSHDASILLGGINTPVFYNLICIDTANHNDIDYVFGAGVRKDGKIVVGEKLQKLLDEDDENEQTEE